MRKIFTTLLRTDQGIADVGKGFERRADRRFFVGDHLAAQALGRSIEAAYNPIMGVDQGIGEQVTPFRGADRKDRQLALPAQIPHAIGVIALSLTPQPRHTLSWNACKQVRGKIEPLKIFQSIEQAIGGG